MERINFGNKGDANAKPLNNNNLKLLQDNIENEFNNITNYSTAETKIGKWMNKDLYRKVVVIVGLPVNTVQSTNYEIESVDQIFIEKAFGVSTAGRIVTLPMVGYNGNVTDKLDIWIDKSNSSIKLFSNGGWGGDWLFCVVLNYTKN